MQAVPEEAAQQGSWQLHAHRVAFLLQLEGTVPEPLEASESLLKPEAFHSCHIGQELGGDAAGQHGKLGVWDLSRGAVPERWIGRLLAYSKSTGHTHVVAVQLLSLLPQ